jgi:hypothetical protein
MKRRIVRIGVVAVSVAVQLAGCNAVLGIHQTLGEEWDGGTSSSSTSASTSSKGSSASSVYTNPLMTGDGAVPVPVDAGAVTHWANWPMPNPPAASLPHPQVYSTTTQGIVHDTVTGLDWQTNTDGVMRSWNDAVNHCASLPDNGGGWRLPSRIELFSIVDYSTTPAINSASFGPLPDDASTLAFWTSSLKAGDNAHAWAVDFGSSVDLIFPQATTGLLFVRCVRGGS